MLSKRVNWVTTVGKNIIGSKNPKKLEKIAKNGKNIMACLVSKILNDNREKIKFLGSQNQKNSK
jgi:hypothetical protein